MRVETYRTGVTAGPTEGWLQARFEWHLEGMPVLAFSPDGKFFATGHEDGSILFWPAEFLWKA